MTAASTGRDRSKISFNGEKYGKGRVVLAIIEQYVKDHPGVTYAKLKEVFPDTLHSLGVVRPVSSARRVSSDHKRFFTDHALKLKDKAVAVCADFGKSNIGKFLKHAAGLGYNARMSHAA
jgi:hypothetical protein